VLFGIGSLELYSHVKPVLEKFVPEVKNPESWMAHLYPVLLVLYSGALCLAGLVLIWAEKKALEARYEDYRALAEGLRLQFFWSMAGVADLAADVDLEGRGPEGTWIEAARRTAAMVTEPASPPDPMQDDGIRTAVAAWVTHQRKWYEKKKKEQKESLDRVRWWTDRALAAAGLITLLVAVLVISWWEPLQGLRAWAADPGRHAVAMLAIPFLTLVPGFYRAYYESSGYSEQAREYGRMALFFRQAEERIEAALEQNDLQTCREVLSRLGRQALAENGEWWMVKKDHRLELRQ
jgi:hypothetical protein